MAQLLDAARAEFGVPLAAGTLRHAHGAAAWERGVLADAELTLSACGVRDGALLTVCADVRGGMEADDGDALYPPPPSRAPRVHRISVSGMQGVVGPQIP